LYLVKKIIGILIICLALIGFIPEIQDFITLDSTNVSYINNHEIEILNKKQLNLGVYLWNPEQYDIQRGFARHLSSLSVDEVYISTGLVKDLKQNYLIAERHGLYSQFISEANKNNISVEALFGIPQWSKKENYHDMTKQVSEVLSYNTKHKSSRFSAVHLDVEPHQLDDWKENMSHYMDEYLENIRKLKTMIGKHNSSNADNLKLVVSLPFWMANAEIGGENFRKELLSIVDTAHIMTYTQNNDWFVSWSKSWLKAADKTDTKITIASEFQEDEKDITLYNFSIEQINQYYVKAYDNFKSHKSFNGFSVHDYNSFIKFLKKNYVD
jgi:hypothetical protein